MTFIEAFQNRFTSLLKSIKTLPNRDSMQEWIRQEIVDDDPWDEETLFPK